MTLEEHKYLGSEEIKAMSTFFKKETKRPLTNYQKRINEAAQELCLANPGLLQKRKLLLDEARAKIIQQGFQFVKGKSRSKQDRNDSQPTQTRRKYSQSMRDQRMRDIEEDSQDLADRIAFKEKRISSCENMRDYKKCDELKEEITALKQQRRQLQAELKGIMKSNYQSKWYYDKKSESSKSSERSSRSRSVSPCSKRTSRSHSSTPYSSSASASDTPMIRCEQPYQRSKTTIPSLLLTSPPVK